MGLLLQVGIVIYIIEANIREDIILKKHKIFIMISMILFLFAGCGIKTLTLKLPSNPMIFTQSDYEEYDCLTLEYDGKRYVPYCAAAVSMCNKVIGYYDSESQGNNDSVRVYVLSCKEWSSDEWIIDCAGVEGEKVSGHNIGMIFREENVKDIPNELQGQSEYKWNQ